jgi:protein-S-isoprenylcysteine O-methyltransferase Ste14
VKWLISTSFCPFKTDTWFDWGQSAQTWMAQTAFVGTCGLARAEERDSLAEFGGSYRQYMEQVPAFMPRLGGRSRSAPGHG